MTPDSTSIARLNELHPLYRPDALKAYNEACLATPVGVHPLITQTLRTFEESVKFYQQGRTTPGSIVSNSKAGQSYHNYGCALDFVLMVNGKIEWDVNHNWMIVVNAFKKYGFTWGGDFPGSFKDYPHLEKKPANWRALLAKYNAKDFIPGTQYINI